jgi:hypothetical protein
MPKKSPFNFNFYKGQYFRSLVSFQLSPTFRFMVGVDFHSCFLFTHFKIVFIWRQRALLYPHPNTSRIKKEEEGAVLFLFSSVSLCFCYMGFVSLIWLSGSEFLDSLREQVSLLNFDFGFYVLIIIYVMFVFSILLWDFCSAF